MNPKKIKLNKGLQHILIYSFTLAGLILLLKLIQWKFLILHNSIDIYVGVISIIFTLLGMWVATQLIKPKTHTIVVEKEVKVRESKPFILNQSALDNLKLTDREYEILKLLVHGHSNAEIAEQLFLSISTIKTHTSNLYAKLDVKNRFQASAKAKRLEIVE